MSERSPAALGAYALAALLALFELAVLWQVLHPQVSADYRAYYIDRTSTCLPQPVTAIYTLGSELDFRTGGNETRELRPCGWDGPGADGLRSIGTSSRLRFAVGTPQDLTLMLELAGTTIDGPDRQRVVLSAGDQVLGELLVTPDRIERFTLRVPAAAIENGHLDLLLDYPDAINPGRIADTYWRAVKLTAASLGPSE